MAHVVVIMFFLLGPLVVKLLCGADLLESFSVPGLWELDDIRSIVRDHGIVVITREGSNPGEYIQGHEVLSRYSDNIHIVTERIPNLGNFQL